MEVKGGRRKDERGKVCRCVVGVVLKWMHAGFYSSTGYQFRFDQFSFEMLNLVLTQAAVRNITKKSQ